MTGKIAAASARSDFPGALFPGGQAGSLPTD
jgi:hypothetical protein